MGEKEQGNPEDAAARSGGYIKMGSVEGESLRGASGGEFMGAGGGPGEAARGGFIKMGSVEGELSQGGGGGGEMRAAPEKKDQQR
ncbi:MAG: hypothetical protein HUU14_03110 [Dehalococcoidia bacterium]|nr:hypothetical protein [Chloroflexi bacterium CFX7]MCK6563434.1 hypothetical protein [Dehalococcoidia bacterium]MCL4231671.1 hypothetical protein [Dehalococcoidia bacterium]NUQ54856.1 hypothetical protein [Dehalococcoidia bacterium]RIL03202.1 MAG: hypothetical protein DCC78_04010 [bacterium]